MIEHAERLRRLGTAERASRAVHDDDRAARDAAIEDAARDNMSTREIGRYVGLDPSTVQHVIVRRTAERQAQLLRDTGVTSGE